MSGSKVLYLLAYVAAVSVGIHARVCGAQDCPQRDVPGGHLVDAELYRGNVLCTYSSSAFQRGNEYACPYDVKDGGLVVEAFDHCNRALSTCGDAIVSKRQIDAVTGEVTAVAGSMTEVAGAVGAVAGAAGAVEGLVPAVPLKRESETITERQLLSGLPIIGPILGGITGGGASSPSALDVVPEAQPAEAKAEARSAAVYDAPATVSVKRQLDGIIGTVGGGAGGLTGVVGSLPVLGGVVSGVEGAAGGAGLPAVAGKRQLGGGGLSGVTGGLSGVTGGLGGVAGGLGGGAGGLTGVVGGLPVLGGVVGTAGGIVGGAGLPVRSVMDEGAVSPDLDSPLHPVDSEEPIPWPTDLPTPVSTVFDLPEPTFFMKLAREY
ncbi:hypothetical protein K523DRAFT_362785 [Schizophyllum commune Tattone D]|nr:hypothetical protein K523DRAFT_362785 [Schizophyllum commune Tattone D]